MLAVLILAEGLTAFSALGFEIAMARLVAPHAGMSTDTWTAIIPAFLYYLALFFQVTAVFLAVFVVQLLIYGFHELTEANLFPYSEPLHWATEPYGPDGRYGQYLSYGLVIVPTGWLIFAALFGGRKSPGGSQKPQGTVAPQPAAR